MSSPRDTLKQYIRHAIREVKMSPSFGKQKPLDSPFDDDKVEKSMSDVKRDVGFALARSLYASDFDKHYDPESREFDDDRAKQIKSTVSAAENQIDADVERILRRIWDRALGRGGGGDSMRPPASQKRRAA